MSTTSVCRDRCTPSTHTQIYIYIHIHRDIVKTQRARYTSEIPTSEGVNVASQRVTRFRQVGRRRRRCCLGGFRPGNRIMDLEFRDATRKPGPSLSLSPPSDVFTVEWTNKGSTNEARARYHRDLREDTSENTITERRKRRTR